MRKFTIAPIACSELEQAAREKIDNLTKPKGSLGRLEELALQVCMIQQTLSPSLNNPYNLLFAADHGIVEEKVSASPKEITWQQISNFLHGGAGINFLCRQHGFRLEIIDAGVDYDSSTAYILNGFSHKITHFKRHNLICSVFYYTVTYLRTNIFLSLEDRLVATIILIQIIYFGAVYRMNEHSVIQNLQNIILRYFVFVCIYDFSTK